MINESKLKCDDQGFLIGEVVAEFVRKNDELEDISQNTRAILDFLTKNGLGRISEAVTPTLSNTNNTVTATTGYTESRGAINSNSTINNYYTTTSATGTDSIKDRQSSTSNNSDSSRTDSSEKLLSRSVNSTTVTPVRDSGGRFVSKDKSTDTTTSATGTDSIKDRQSSNLMAEKISDSIEGALSNNSQLDPVIAAASEVFTPLNRGLKALSWLRKSKEDNKQTSLLKRLFSSATISENTASKRDKKTQKKLQELIDKPIASSESIWGKLLSGFGMLLMPVIAALGAILAAIGKLIMATVGKVIPSVGGNAKTTTVGSTTSTRGSGKPDSKTPPTSAQGASGGGIKSLAKRIPILGALIGGALVAGELSDNADSDKTQSEKDKESGRIVGGFTGAVGGALGGAALGAAVGSVIPVVGTLIGGLVGGVLGGVGGDIVGQSIGKKVGEWTNQLRDADIAGSVKNSWMSFTDFATNSWSSVSTNISSAWDSVRATTNEVMQGASSKFNSLIDQSKPYFDSFYQGISNFSAQANDWILSLTGINVQEKFSEFFAKAGASFESIKDSVKSSFSELKDKSIKAFDYVKNNTVVGKAVSAAAEKIKNSNVVEKAKEVYSDVKQKGKNIYSDLSGKTAENKSTLIKEMDSRGMTDQSERAMFMAQMSHESGGFRQLSENLNYSSVDRIKQTFGNNAELKKLNDDQLKGLVNNPEALANTVYGNRMGNTEAGDGYKYRGRGFTQLTGKNNYEAAGKDLGVDLVNSPELAESPEMAAKIASWYWEKNKLGNAAKAGDVSAVTQKINGGQNGIGHREQEYKRFMADESIIARTDSANSTQNTAKVEATAASTQESIAPISVSVPKVASVDVASIPIPKVPQQMPMTIASTQVAAPVENVKTSSSIQVESRSSAAEMNAPRDVSDRRIAHIVTGGMASA